MAEFDSAKTGYQLNIDRKYYNSLDIQGFTQMMKDPSYCYKFYWLEAIVCLISENVTDTIFDAVIDEMIANAWYSVVEFHVHLSGVFGGEVKDSLERAVLYSHIHEKEQLHHLYEKCYRDNLHSIWANQELYHKGNTKEIFLNILNQNMRPVYDSARRQGYEIWNY